MRKYFGYVLVVVLLGTALSFSCAAPVPAPAPAEPIKIGVCSAMTGYMAHDEGEVLKGVNIKLDEIGYEVAGRKIELIAEDYASDPVTAVDKARKMVESDKVDVIIGPLEDAAGAAVIGYVKKSGVLNIAVHAHTHEVMEAGGGNLLQWSGTTPGYGYYLGLYAYDKLGYRTAVAIAPDIAEGQDIVGGALQAFEDRGGKIIKKQLYSMDARDLSPYMTIAGKADACFFWAFGGLIAPFLGQYYDSGLRMPILLPIFDCATEQELAEVGDKCLGMIGTDFYSPEIDTPLNRQFVDAFLKKYGYYPSALPAGGDIAVAMFLEAVKANNGNTSKDAIKNTINKIKVEGPFGTVSMSPTSPGLGVHDLYICKTVKKGDRYIWDVLDKYSQIVVEEPRK